MKVVKFGGSSMADAGQYRKIRDIIAADSDRKIVVVSAAGKRFKEDHKITDLLYLCYAHTQYGVDCTQIFNMIRDRYISIRNDLGLTMDLETEFNLTVEDEALGGIKTVGDIVDYIQQKG